MGAREVVNFLERDRNPLSHQNNKMEKNDIKKALYRQNPIAEFKYIRKGKAYYNTVIQSNDSTATYSVTFEVPVEDMGDADFHSEMESKLLQRWIM